MRPKTTTSKIIDALGGSGEVAKIFGINPHVVYNWRSYNKFPANTYVALQARLKRRGIQAPDHLWAMRFPAAKDGAEE